MIKSVEGVATASVPMNLDQAKRLCVVLGIPGQIEQGIKGSGKETIFQTSIDGIQVAIGKPQVGSDGDICDFQFLLPKISRSFNTRS